MVDVEFIWDLEDDTEGNVHHIAEHGVSIEEAEEVVRASYQATVASRSSGRPTAFGRSSTGKHMAVVFEIVDKQIPLVYVVTAFEAPAPRPGRRRKKR